MELLNGWKGFKNLIKSRDNSTGGDKETPVDDFDNSQQLSYRVSRFLYNPYFLVIGMQGPD